MKTVAPTLSVVLPAYNEEGNITRAVEVIHKYLSKGGRTFEIIVVDDGSKDGTAKLVKDISHANVRLVSHAKNKGYGAALKSGFNAARNDYIFFTDSDLQFDIQDLALLEEHMDPDTFVLGYRAKRSDHAIRKLNARLFGIAVRILYGLKVKDIDCAFKLMPRHIVHSLQIQSDGAFINSEMLIKAHATGVKMHQVAVRHLPRERGTQTGANPKVIARALNELVGFRKHLKEWKKRGR